VMPYQTRPLPQPGGTINDTASFKKAQNRL
jgi:hypothetical protein